MKRFSFKELECPGCLSRGDLDDSKYFIQLGRHQGSLIAQCNACKIYFTYSNPASARFFAMLISVVSLMYSIIGAIGSKSGLLLLGSIVSAFFFLLVLANKPYNIEVVNRGMETLKRKQPKIQDEDQ